MATCLLTLTTKKGPTMLVDLISGLFIGAGGLFVLIGALGIIRLPDVFSRMQSVSLIETVGAGLLCMGFIVKVGFSLVGAEANSFAHHYLLFRPCGNSCGSSSCFSCGCEAFIGARPPFSRHKGGCAACLSEC